MVDGLRSVGSMLLWICFGVMGALGGADSLLFWRIWSDGCYEMRGKFVSVDIFGVNGVLMGV